MPAVLVTDPLGVGKTSAALARQLAEQMDSTKVDDLLVETDGRSAEEVAAAIPQ